MTTQQTTSKAYKIVGRQIPTQIQNEIEHMAHELHQKLIANTPGAVKFSDYGVLISMTTPRANSGDEFALTQRPDNMLVEKDGRKVPVAELPINAAEDDLGKFLLARMVLAHSMAVALKAGGEGMPIDKKGRLNQIYKAACAAVGLKMREDNASRGYCSVDAVSQETREILKSAASKLNPELSGWISLAAKAAEERKAANRATAGLDEPGDGSEPGDGKGRKGFRGGRKGDKAKNDGAMYEIRCKGGCHTVPGGPFTREQATALGAFLNSPENFLGLPGCKAGHLWSMELVQKAKATEKKADTNTAPEVKTEQADTTPAFEEIAA